MVYSKLMQARIKLQGMAIKKSGENKFAGYKYFELGDFLPPTMQIFHDLGLASVVSFADDYATLRIIDTEDGTEFTISSPMSAANLKGAHPIQNLGAVESYQRRYLWLSAMEIVEHDIIDASSGAETKTETKAEPKVEKKVVRPANVIKGQPGDWQIQVSLEPEGSTEEWLKAVEVAAATALSFATAEADVMSIFKKNKVLFDAVKAVDDVFFKELMSVFTTTKNSFTKE